MGLFGKHFQHQSPSQQFFQWLVNDQLPLGVCWYQQLPSREEVLKCCPCLLCFPPWKFDAFFAMHEDISAIWRSACRSYEGHLSFGIIPLPHLVGGIIHWIYTGHSDFCVVLDYDPNSFAGNIASCHHWARADSWMGQGKKRLHFCRFWIDLSSMHY